MAHIKNILYSLYLGAGIKFIFVYIKNLFFNRKIYSKNISFKNKFEEKISQLKSEKKLIGLEMQIINFNIPLIYNILSDEKLLKKKNNILILGCYEGHSTLFFLMNCINSKFICVDIWNKKKFTKKYNKDAEKYFENNINLFRGRVTKIKNRSQLFFQNNKKKFDLIYLDGSHSRVDVEMDCSESLKFLNDGGIFIINSVFWRGFKNLRDNNLLGIINFLKKKGDSLRILQLTRNILILKKI